MFLGLRVSVERFKSLLHNNIYLFDLTLVQGLENFRFQCILHIFVLLSHLLVAFEEDLDCIDAKRNELFPSNLAISVFVSKCQQNS